MTFYFSSKTLGFFSSDIHGHAFPDDVVEISTGVYESLLSGQAMGKRIVAHESGLPMLLEPAAPDEATLRSGISARRFLAETLGVEVNGVTYATSRDSQALMSNVVHAAMLDSSYCCNWKTPEGFIELGPEQIFGMATAVRAHIQACFDREAELLAHLDAGTFTESMLDEGWPS
ncbi:DUF4376 domain-containing protein [Pseudomonas sp. Pseusp97]|uniref:DUF4376 domain-containing protein n=1 Tax=Pseudomonas sp. Pseusp97 TaxID=3243065 RepID=UPI0039A6C0A0